MVGPWNPCFLLYEGSIEKVVGQLNSLIGFAALVGVSFVYCEGADQNGARSLVGCSSLGE